MTEHEMLVDRYIDAWNETNMSRRETLAEQVLLANGRYVDPMMNSTGPQGFADMIGEFQSAMPGLSFERVGKIDATGKTVRFSWRLIDATGRQFASGTDIGDFCVDGRFASITGFIDSAITNPDWSVEKYAAFWAAPDFSKPSDELAAGIEGYWPGLDAPLSGIEAYVRPLHELVRRVPDFRLEVADHASRGDTVFIRWVATGTHGGEPLRFEGVDCVRHKDGQVYENRIFCDHPLVLSLNR
ncbi:nuclear transport factor 2 family protein [Burkholderia sp. Leaf177]|uniref:nuclear transport factor 2 family protein n=1 Tax=Burkholderia sp. Leaf177 TaxID=1736287 RepID=UPI0006F99056|nr:nuclear transport factor 2 family protein [Burkholderia sp. Leaf177]